jgi:hypothetical protein
MSETETILKNESGVKAYQGEHPPTMGLKAGAFADVGTIILTSRRLVYINKGGAARAATYVLGGALAARAAEKNVSRAELDDAAKYPGSYSISLQDITKVETARHFGSAYLRVDNKSSYLKPAHSFILGSGFSKNEDWVAAINSAIITSRSPPARVNSAPLNNPAPGYNIPPPPAYPANIVTPRQPVQMASVALIVCPSCGTSSKPSAKFCGACSASLEPPKPVAVAPKPKAKFCSNCGAPIGFAARFCESCGSKIAE